MSRPVTVVVPAHGTPGPLSSLLRALDGQARGGKALNVIVSDDASPRPLADEVDTRSLRGLDLRFVRSESNGGPGAARNRGLAEVRTGWVAFIDADELPTAGWLERLEEIVTGPEPPDVIAGRVEVPRDFGPFEHATEAAADEEQYVAGNVAFRTHQLVEDGGFDERFYDAGRGLHFREDAELRFRLEAARRRFAYVPELIVTHPPLPRSWRIPLRLARRYYFDPLLSREHPGRFRAHVRARRVGFLPLRLARHLAAHVYLAGAVAGAAGLVLGEPLVAALGGAVFLAGWGLNVAALAFGRRVRLRDLLPLAAAGALVPLVYLWSYYRGVIAFGHRARL
jgi:glycosyltransferase involved in cell wall biosynthesis